MARPGRDAFPAGRGQNASGPGPVDGEGQVRGRAGRRAGAGAVPDERRGGGVWESVAGIHGWTGSPDLRAIARAKFAAVHADPRSLTRAKYAAAVEESEARWKEFLAGRGTQDILLGAWRRRLESRLALAENDADRLAAREE